MLVKFFTFKIARRLKRNIDSISVETLRALSHMEWAGNVRELENFIERAVLLTRGNVLNLTPQEIGYNPFTARHFSSTVPNKCKEDEYHHILKVLRETNGVIAGPRGAAQRLGLKRTTLISRMKRLGIDKRLCNFRMDVVYLWGSFDIENYCTIRASSACQRRCLQYSVCTSVKNKRERLRYYKQP